MLRDINSPSYIFYPLASDRNKTMLKEYDSNYKNYKDYSISAKAVAIATRYNF